MQLLNFHLHLFLSLIELSLKIFDAFFLYLNTFSDTIFEFAGFFILLC
jgi:hypothetical protein